MADTNKVIISGRLTRDVETSMTQSGIEVANFSVACNRMKKQGEEKAQADFFDCVAWRSTAKFLDQYVHKGDFVIVEGRMQNDTYQAQDGSNRKKTRVNVERVQVCGGKPQAQQAQQQNVFGVAVGEVFDTGEEVVTDDDLPF